MKLIKILLNLSLISGLLNLICAQSYSHELVAVRVNSKAGISQAQISTVHYLGNEGVMIVEGEVKVLFDPFFHNSYGYYTLVPEKIRQAIFANQAPYDNIQAIFISHAHEDHFDKEDVSKYLLANQNVKLIAPSQAVIALETLSDFNKIKSRVIAINLQKGDKAQEISVNNIKVEAVRIPHAGWPQRAEVENLVYRVKLNQQMVVIHMGDADPDLQHFNEHKTFWPKEQTNIAFPPYWFSLSNEGQHILANVINAKKVIGVHVPTRVPENLKATGMDYFSIPAEIREIEK